MTTAQKIIRAQDRGTPLIGLETPDAGRTREAILAAAAAAGNGRGLLEYDLAEGLRPADTREPSIAAALAIVGHAAGADPEDGPEAALAGLAAATTRNPTAAAKLLRRAPGDTMTLVWGAHELWDDKPYKQAVANLRDDYKTNYRTLVLIGPTMEAPAALKHDVLIFSDELPTEPELHVLVSDQLTRHAEQLNFPITAELTTRAASTLRGLSAFEAEQVLALSLEPDGLEWETLRGQSHRQIEQTKGLHVERGNETRGDIRGLGAVLEYGERYFRGPRRPQVTVRIEEFEKAMAGSTGGDLSGVSQDSAQVLLTALQDYGWSGMLCIGVPGSGKSLFAKALARSHGALPMVFDPQACKDKLMGSSGANIRAAVSVIRAIAGDRAFFVASCNSMANITPEMEARFRGGVWFFDAPDEHGRAAMWQQYRAQYGLPEQDTPDDDDWVGRDIWSVCESAYALDTSLLEAARFYVPMKTRRPGSLDAMRAEADGRYLDATRGGLYQRPQSTDATARRLKTAYDAAAAGRPIAQ